MYMGHVIILIIIIQILQKHKAIYLFILSSNSREYFCINYIKLKSYTVNK